MNPDRPGDGLARRLFTNTLHAAGGRFAGLVVWLVFTPLILRAIGSERFAIWSLFYALTGYLAALDLGLAQATLRFVAAARGRGDHGEAGAFATLALLGYGVLAALLALIVIPLTGAVLGWLRIPAELQGAGAFAVRYGVLVFLLMGCANVTIAVAQGYGRFDLANRVLLLLAAQQAAGMALVLGRGWGLEGLIVNVAVGGVLGTIAGVLALRRGLPDFRWAGPGGAVAGVREALRFGVPVQITNLLAMVNVHVDKLLLARFAGLARVTAYELGSRVALSATSLPQLLLLPVLAEASAFHGAGQHERLRSLHDRGGRYFLTLSALCVAPLLAGAPRLYAAWLGGPEPDAALTLQWLAVATGVSMATGLATTLARGVGRPVLETWFAIVTVALHVAGSLVLVPRLGLVGALAASVIAHALGGLVFLALFARWMHWPLASSVLRPWAIPVLAVAIGWAAGRGADLALPAVTGPAAWLAAAGVAAAAVLGAAAVALLAGYLRWDEARALLRGFRTSEVRP